MQGIAVQIVVVILMAMSQLEVESTAADGPIIDTASGQVIGSQSKVPFTSSNYTSFLGIPYAEPPLGALRFAKPLTKKPWQGVRDALSYGPECPQKTSNASETTDEDCLFLNVFVPVDAVTESSQLPVMVWFHGGSFTSGSGSTYIGMKLATYGEVVVVNLNYRLGLLGFLCTGDEASPGNYGLWDQRLAVQWVKHNIRNFGGDPEQITIFGESAGAMSVSYHALSPVNDRSLFQKVIAESGAADDSLLMGGETCRANAEAIGGAVGCDTTNSTRSLIDCLRKVPSQTFVTLQSQPAVIGDTSIGPTLDGEFISDRISNLRQSSNLAQYDLLTGVNSDDGSYFGIDPDGVDAQLFTLQTSRFLDTGYKSKNPELLIDAASFYYTNGVLSNPKTNQKSLMVMAGDAVFYAPTINNLRHHFDASRSSRYKTHRYLYYFSMKFFRSIFIPDGFEEYIDGAPHGLDVVYVYGLVAAVPLPTPAYKLSIAMMKYWSNFAKTGDPNGSDLPTWPIWDPMDEQYIVLDKKISTRQHLLTGRISFWLDYFHKLLQPIDPNVCPLGVPLRAVETHQPGTKITGIKTDKGVVLGNVIGSLKRADPAMGGKEVAEFLGIPYAEPPVGRYRFQPARDVLPWEGLLNGTVEPPACPQIAGNDPWMVVSGFVETDEDCLTLNIYSPTTPSAGQNRPVVVYVHHGFGMYGTASVYEATTLSSKSNAVIVVINYRLGALGFLSTEDENAPGNAGLHDILAALGWVQKYIGSFGGDANRVTLAGYGAGASLAHALTASKKSKGLFRQCILMGGSVFDPVMSNTVQVGPAKQAATLAEKLGCPTNTHAAMIQCLQRQPVTSLVADTPRQPLSTAFRPVVDGDILTDAPTKLIRAGKINEVDCIIGSNQHWMDYQVASLIPNDLQSCPNKLELTTLMKNTIKMFFHSPDLVSKAVLNEYVEDSGNNESFCSHRQQLRWFMQDFLSTVPTMEAAHYHSMGNNTVYLYSFNHDPKYHYSSPVPSWTGTSLGDDLQYLFGFPYWPAISYPITGIPSYRLTDKKTTIEWTGLLSSFIHNGSPGVSLSGTEWPPYSAIHGKMMSISTCPCEEPSTMPRNRYQFWTDVVPSIAAISDEPSVEPTNPDNCVIDGGLGLKLSSGQANGTIQALFGIMMVLIILNSTFVVLYLVLRSRNKNKRGQYISSQERAYENPSGVEIGSF